MLCFSIMFRLCMRRGIGYYIGDKCQFGEFVTSSFILSFDYNMINETFLSSVAITDLIFVLRNIFLFHRQMLFTPGYFVFPISML